MNHVRPLLQPLSNIEPNKRYNIALGTWLAVAIFSIIQCLIAHRCNNYLIFENTFRNLINQASFYSPYPQYHYDANHYGPIFSVFFMPFALLPNAIGFLFWNLFTTVFLFKAVSTLPLKNITTLYLIAIPCLVSSCLSQQSNPLIGAFIILSYTLLNKDKGLWSTLFIMLGTFIKLYGIVGLAFFFFVKDKKRFVVYLLMWSAVFFLLPMLFSSPSFIVNSYREWGVSLASKNASNIMSTSQDISIMGFIRNLFVGTKLSNLVFLVSGAILFLIPYLNFKSFTNQKFQEALKYPFLFTMLSLPYFIVWILTIIDAYNLKTNKSHE